MALRWMVAGTTEAAGSPTHNREIARFMHPCAACHKPVLLVNSCAGCGSKFCDDHAGYASHSCPSVDCTDCTVRIWLGKRSAEQALQLHFETGQCAAGARQPRECSLTGCRQKHLDCTTLFRCRQCNTNFCTRHRLPEDHRCGQAVQPAPAPTRPAPATWQPPPPQRATAGVAPARPAIATGSRQQPPRRVAVPVRSMSGSQRQPRAAAAAGSPPLQAAAAAAARPAMTQSRTASQQLVRAPSGRAQRQLADQKEALATAQMLFDEVEEDTDAGLAVSHFLMAISTLEDCLERVAASRRSAECEALMDRCRLAAARRELRRQNHDECIQHCTVVLSSTSQPSAKEASLCLRGQALLAMEVYEGAISNFELAAVTAQGALLASVLDSLEQARREQARKHLLAAGLSDNGAAGSGGPSAPAAPAGVLDAQGASGCMSCGARRLDGALLHGTTLHICVCWACASRLCERRKPCPRCRAPIDSIARVG